MNLKPLFSRFNRIALHVAMKAARPAMLEKKQKAHIAIVSDYVQKQEVFEKQTVKKKGVPITKSPKYAETYTKRKK